MDYKTISIDNEDFYLVPKLDKKEIIKNKVDIKVTRISRKKEVYVDAVGLWSEPDKNIKHVRIEDEMGNYEWNRTYGGYVSARKEDVIKLESWYQATINTNN